MPSIPPTVPLNLADATLLADGRTLRLRYQAAPPWPANGFGVPDYAPGVAAGLALTASNGSTWEWFGSVDVNYERTCGNTSVFPITSPGTFPAGTYYIA